MNRLTVRYSIIGFLLTLTDCVYSQGGEIKYPPFEYFDRPFAAIGVYGGPKASMITPQGYVSTDFGTLRFYTSDQKKPVVQKLKKLRNGYLPIVEMHFDDKLSYSFTYFAANDLNLGTIPVEIDKVEGTAQSILNFVKVVIANNTKQAQHFSFYVGLDFSVTVNQLPKFYDFFKSSGEMDSAAFLNLKDLAFDIQNCTLSNDNNVFLGSSIMPGEIVGLENKYEYLLKYTGELKPGEHQEIVLKMPYWALNKGYIDSMQKADYQVSFDKTVAFWENLLSQHMQFTIPERKVTDTYKAGLMNILTSGLKIIETSSGTEIIQHVNSFQYDSYFIRDAAKFIHGFDYLGMHELAKAEIFYLLNNYQSVDGVFTSHEGEHDGIGQGLWAVGQHYLITKDTAFAYLAFPYLVKAVDWLINHRKLNGGIIAATSVLDNELVQNAHYLGHNVWALMGLKSVLPIARLVDENMYKSWQKEYDDYYQVFQSKLNELTYKTGGLITPSFEGFDGYAPYTSAYGKVCGIDWGNLMVAYPSGLISANDPRMDISMKVWKSLFHENLFLYPVHMDFANLHHYNTQYIAGTMLMRDEQEDVLKFLYDGYLVHTTACNAGPEGIEGTMKDYGHIVNITPHGQSAIRYIWMLREMFIREEGNNIHLLGAISPEWLKINHTTGVTDAPTNFGEMSVSLSEKRNCLVVDIKPPTRDKFDSFILHIPFWFNAGEAIINDVHTKLNGERSIKLNPEQTHIVLVGKMKPGIECSYAIALQKYKSNFSKFNTALQTGKTMEVPVTNQNVVIDGKIGSEWAKAAKMDDFVSADETASKPVQKTTARLMKNGDKLLVAFECDEKSPSTEYPSVWTHDYVGLNIEIDKSKNLFYAIAVDINNNTEVFEYSRVGFGWITPTVKKVTLDGLKSAVVKHDGSYSVEIEVPIVAKDNEFKFNLLRNDASPNKIFNQCVWKFTGYNLFAFENFPMMKFK